MNGFILEFSRIGAKGPSRGFEEGKRFAEGNRSKGYIPPHSRKSGGAQPYPCGQHSGAQPAKHI
jgi:hypothetical protein